jgi:Tfp pilus assembly protein PilP
MKTFITTTIVFLLIVSCGNKNEPDNVKQSREQVKEIIKDLPNLKEEVDAIEKELDAKQITGSIEIIANGKTLEFNTFSGKKSNVNFKKNTAKYRFYITDKRKEYVQVELKNDNLYSNASNENFVPSMFVLDINNTEEVKKMMQSNIQISYHNKDTGERYYSGKGNVKVQKLTDNKLQLTYIGEGYNGDYRMKKFIPMNINININNNFISYDGRNK